MDSLRERFARDGFVGPVDILSGDEVAEVRDAVADVVANLARYRDRLYEVEEAFTDRPGEVVCHFLGGFRVHETLRRLIVNERITSVCADLLAVHRLRSWHDQVFAKPPHHPGVVPWHQDYSYWQRTEPACHITCNLLLDDSDEQSGCLQFVPGSHRWPLLPPVPFDASLDSIRAHVPEGATWRPIAVPSRAGQATFHHSHTLHGSDQNRSERWRRAGVCNYMGPQVRVADGREPLLRGVPKLPTGAIVSGDDFPIVFDRQGAGR